MKCPKCQFENLEEMKFCGKCGSKLAILCDKCGFENPDGYDFCGKCGGPLQQAPDTSEIDYKKPQSYTPKHLADKILTIRSSIEGERKFVTVLFADVANYTSISEKLDPEEVHQIMDGCFKILMDEIHKYEGTINQFTGDGVMALFGAPVAHEDHAQRACYAAITIQSSLEKYSKDLESKFDIQFKMRVGINSGLVVVGSIGDDLRMDYTAVGDTTNLAARMESSANPGTILLSDNTQKLVRDFFELESIGEIEIKGKKELQKAFKLIKTGTVGTRIGASVAKGLTRFVGRKNSIDTLIGVFEKIKSGSGQIVGIVGEAGVGKSRLLLEMRNMFPQDEFEYLEGRCLQYGGSILYLPILDILRSVFNIKDDDKEFIVKQKIKDVILNLDDQFSSLNPSFQDILSLKIDDEGYLKLEPKEKRDKIFEAIRNLLVRMSQNKPLVIAVEDLHWIDKTSEEFLNYFIDWLANTPILLIFLYRPEYTHQWGSKSFYTKIGVDQLGLDSSGELVKAILVEGEVAAELKQLILNRSAGNPLFMEEFTHTLVENGSIEKRDNQFALKGSPQDIKVPDTIQGIIAARLDRLEDNLKRTMQVASVIGRDFAFKILQSITGVRTELKSHLLNLQGLEFIYEKNLFPELEYIFKHALTQEVAYNSLLQKRRKEIHEKIGTAIEELYPERLEEFYEMLAYHYCKSDNDDKAIHYLKLSAEKAEKNYSYWDSYNFFKTLFNMLENQPDSSENKKERLNLLLSMMVPLHVLGMPDDSLWTIEKAIDLGKEMKDDADVSMFYIAKANYYSYRGNNDLAYKYSEDAYAEAKKNQNIESMVQSSFGLSMAYMSTGNFKKIITILPEILESLEKNKKEFELFSLPLSPYSSLSAYCGLAMGNLGCFEDGDKVFKKARDHSSKIEDKFAICQIEFSYGIFFIGKGEWHSAIECLQKGIIYAHEIKWPWIESFGNCTIGYATAMLGDYEKSNYFIRKGLEMYDSCGVKLHLASAYCFIGSAFQELGNAQLAGKYIEKALKISIENNERSVDGRSNIHMGNLIGKNDPLEKQNAINHIKKGIETLKTLGARPYYAIGYLYLGEIYLDTYESEKAVENLKLAEGMFQEMGIDFWLNKTQKLLAEL